VYVFHVTVRTKKVNSFFFLFSVNYAQLDSLAGRRAFLPALAPVILVRSNLFKVWESLFAHFYKRSSILSLSESGICLDPDHSLPKFHPPPPSFTQSIRPTPLPLSNGCLVLDQMPTGKLRKPVSVSWPLFFLLFCFFISSFLFFSLFVYAIPAGQAAWVGVLERVGVGVAQAISGSFDISRCNGTGRVKIFLFFFSHFANPSKSRWDSTFSL
jgi:hypothetical protein